MLSFRTLAGKTVIDMHDWKFIGCERCIQKTGYLFLISAGDDLSYDVRISLDSLLGAFPYVYSIDRDALISANGKAIGNTKTLHNKAFRSCKS